MILKTVINKYRMKWGAVIKKRKKQFSRITKKGSYLVEASITLPILIISLICMSSIILMYACIEDCNFMAANEIRRAACESIVSDTAATFPYRVKKQIVNDHHIVESAWVTDFGYRVTRWDTDELIAMSVLMKMNSRNPIGMLSKAEYEISVVTRAYVGRFRGYDAMSADEFGSDGNAVFIFPKRGEKYHSEGCRHLKAASTSGILTADIKRKYKSCPLCKSGKAANGTLIYYFPAAGEDYHLRGCGSLQRNYIEIERQVAIDRGYRACATCGG